MSSARKSRVAESDRGRQATGPPLADDPVSAENREAETDAAATATSTEATPHVGERASIGAMPLQLDDEIAQHAEAVELAAQRRLAQRTRRDATGAGQRGADAPDAAYELAAAGAPEDWNEATAAHAPDSLSNATLNAPHASDPDNIDLGAVVAFGADDPDSWPSEPEDSTGTEDDVLTEEQDDVLDVIDELAGELGRYQDIRGELEKKLFEVTDRLRESNERIGELEWQNIALRARVESAATIRQNLADTESRLARSHEQIESLQQNLEHYRQEDERLNDELRSAQRKIEGLWAVQAERDRLEADVERLRIEGNDLRQSFADLHDDRVRIEAELKETLAKLRESQAQRTRLEVDLKTHADRYAKMQRVQETLGEKLVLLRGEKKVLQEQYNQLERQCAAVVDEKRALQYELITLRQRNRHAADVISRAKQAFGDVRVALSKTRTRVRTRPEDVWPELGQSLRYVDEALARCARSETDGATQATSDE